MRSGETTGGPGERSGHGDAARAVMRATDRAVLTTAQRDAAGWPYPSLVLVALDHDATPLLLISTLADHTLNIAADPRVGLLFDGTAGLEQPLAGARVSVLGHALRSEEPRHRARFLARHPSADIYVGFKDFAVYRVAVERAHLVAGFGRVRWLEAADLLLPPVPQALVDQEGAIVRHMNDDHADALQLYATALLGFPQRDGDGPGWTMTGVDPEGCDLRRGAEVARLPFGQRVAESGEVRAELVRLVRQARAGGGEGVTSAGHPAS
ncbi:HugZ family protein [Azospirillum sp. RWY-5-1]|uniref:HugZ family protein n=1 Tax=Azospirillum oleiclasticum TaxID=2735135 RepID=A0ABX2TL48_9PROT|nr:DUF2470 domain-containing protein [Azospirillum oleiclasticum]NYZ17872.1 HugZ family protein [Azospirillum oleiclasticum]NYZ25080.1 HugZ family protein [Azospirillum oleiclasticum]